MVLKDGLEKVVAPPWAVVKLASYISSKLNAWCRTDFSIFEECMMLGVVVQHDEAWCALLILQVLWNYVQLVISDAWLGKRGDCCSLLPTQNTLSWNLLIHFQILSPLHKKSIPSSYRKWVHFQFLAWNEWLYDYCPWFVGRCLWNLQDSMTWMSLVSLESLCVMSSW